MERCRGAAGTLRPSQKPVLLSHRHLQKFYQSESACLPGKVSPEAALTIALNGSATNCHPNTGAESLNFTGLQFVGADDMKGDKSKAVLASRISTASVQMEDGFLITSSVSSNDDTHQGPSGGVIGAAVVVSLLFAAAAGFLALRRNQRRRMLQSQSGVRGWLGRTQVTTTSSIPSHYGFPPMTALPAPPYAGCPASDASPAYTTSPPASHKHSEDELNAFPLRNALKKPAKSSKIPPSAWQGGATTVCPNDSISQVMPNHYQDSPMGTPQSHRHVQGHRPRR